MATSFKNFLKGIGIVPKGVSESTEKGDIEFLTTNDKLHIFNGSVNDPIVSETIAATLENKTLDAPVINDATADTISGIAGGTLTLQSASNQNLSLQAQGSGVVLLEGISVTGTTITDVATITNSAGNITLEGITHSSTTNSITGGSATFLIQSATDQNLSLQAQGTGSVSLESLTISGSSISNSGGSVTIEGISIDSTVITGASMANGTGTFTFNTSGAITAPNGTDTLAGISLSQTLTNKTIAAGSNTITGLTNSNLSGSAGITNANLANSSITINGSSVSLGGSVTVTATATNALTIGTGLSGTSYNGSAPVTIAIDSSVVTLTGSQALSNKTLSSPIINTPTADTITGIAGGALTIQSASNQNLSLQAQGSGSVLLESLSISGNNITGGASLLSIFGANDQDVLIRASGTGEVYFQKDTSTVAYVDTAAFVLANNSELQLRESSGSGSNYVGIKAASTLSGDYTITLPSAAPTANTALSYNGSSYVWGQAGGWTTGTSTSLTAGGTISISLTAGQQAFTVASSSGAVTLSSTPFGSSDPVDGAVVRLIGTSNTNTVSLTNNDAANGCILNGNITLNAYDVIELQYMSSLDRWVEVMRNK